MVSVATQTDDVGSIVLHPLGSQFDPPNITIRECRLKNERLNGEEDEVTGSFNCKCPCIIS